MVMLALLFAVAAAPAPLRYHLDSSQSQVAAKVGVMGLASKTARFPKMAGGIQLSPERLETINLDVALDARALVATDETTTKQLRGPKFFDVERHPTVRFAGQRMTMTGPTTAKLEGSITARGVTRPTRLSITFAQPRSPVASRSRSPPAVRLTAAISA
jgi:polyisoprenoid-binding protein YceI